MQVIDQRRCTEISLPCLLPQTHFCQRHSICFHKLSHNLVHGKKVTPINVPYIFKCIDNWSFQFRGQNFYIMVGRTSCSGKGVSHEWHARGHSRIVCIPCIVVPNKKNIKCMLTWKCIHDCHLSTLSIWFQALTASTLYSYQYSSVERWLGHKIVESSSFTTAPLVPLLFHPPLETPHATD